MKALRLVWSHEHIHLPVDALRMLRTLPPRWGPERGRRLRGRHGMGRYPIAGRRLEHAQYRTSRERGTRFTRFRGSACVFRIEAALLTGCYPNGLGIRHWVHPPGVASMKTRPRWLNSSSRRDTPRGCSANGIWDIIRDSFGPSWIRRVYGHSVFKRHVARRPVTPKN